MRRSEPGVMIGLAPERTIFWPKNIFSSVMSAARCHLESRRVNTHVSARTRSSLIQFTRVGSSTGPYGESSMPQMKKSLAFSTCINGSVTLEEALEIEKSTDFGSGFHLP